jgi:type IV pilus assembly protein PilX
MQTLPTMTSLRRQCGSVLAIALIFLLLMTLIGVTAMRTTTMQERMAGNMRDRNLAFQAAEVALREGEKYLTDSVVMDTFDNTGGLYQPAGADEHNHWDVIDWLADANSRPVTASLDSVARQPRYIVEEMAAGSSETPASLEADAPLTETRVYRITTMGWGGNINTQVMLQTRFRRQ